MITMGMGDETCSDLSQIIIKSFFDFMEADTGLEDDNLEKGFEEIAVARGFAAKDFECHQKPGSLGDVSFFHSRLASGLVGVVGGGGSRVSMMASTGSSSGISIKSP